MARIPKTMPMTVTISQGRVWPTPSLGFKAANGEDDEDDYDDDDDDDDENGVDDDGDNQPGQSVTNPLIGFQSRCW